MAFKRSWVRIPYAPLKSPYFTGFFVMLAETGWQRGGKHGDTLFRYDR